MSVLKVSLPIDQLDFSVSVPVTAFPNAPVLTLCELHRRLQSWDKIPQGNYYLIRVIYSDFIVLLGWSSSAQVDSLTFYKVSSSIASEPVVCKAIKVNSDFTWAVMELFVQNVAFLMLATSWRSTKKQQPKAYSKLKHFVGYCMMALSNCIHLIIILCNCTCSILIPHTMIIKMVKVYN